MSASKNEEQNTRQVGEALLSVATSLQAVAQVLLGTNKSDKLEKRRAVKKDKDPFAPKRNLTSYIFFVQQVRERIAQENPSLTAIDIARILGERWNALTDKEKQPFIKRAADDKARFDKEMDVYRKENGIPAPESKRKKAAPAPAQTSKRPAPPVEAPVANKKKAKNSKPVEEKAEPKQDKKKGNKKR